MANILVIDDDEQVLFMLEAILKRTGHEILYAIDGILGMKICRGNPVDLVITDIIMPEMDGLEIIVELKRECPDVKIIVISGGTRIEPNNYLKMADLFDADRIIYYTCALSMHYLFYLSITYTLPTHPIHAMVSSAQQRKFTLFNVFVFRNNNLAEDPNSVE